MHDLKTIPLPDTTAATSEEKQEKRKALGWTVAPKLKELMKGSTLKIDPLFDFDDGNNWLLINESQKTLDVVQLEGEQGSRKTWKALNSSLQAFRLPRGISYGGLFHALQKITQLDYRKASHSSLVRGAGFREDVRTILLSLSRNEGKETYVHKIFDKDYLNSLAFGHLVQDYALDYEDENQKLDANPKSKDINALSFLIASNIWEDFKAEHFRPLFSFEELQRRVAEILPSALREMSWTDD